MAHFDVSVVIPAYNAEKTLERAVASCFQQGDIVLEIVIVDDCSTDGTGQLTESLAEHYGRETIRVVHNKENMQSLESRRYGFEHGSGTFVAFLDSDDELAPNCLGAAMKTAKDESADIVVFPILPRYEKGDRPEQNIIKAREEMYAAPNKTLEGVEIVHATFSEADIPANSIVWSIVGKLFSRDLMSKSLAAIPARRMFHSEDAYWYFVLATLAKKAVSNSSLPPYVYHMGIGGTLADHMLTPNNFEKICLNANAACYVEEHLKTLENQRELRDDYENLRRRLCLDPANRFVNNVSVENAPACFDVFLSHWPATEAISGLAELGWWNPSPICSAAAKSKSLQPKIKKVQVVATYYHSLGIGEAENVVRNCCNLWRSMGLSVVLLIDEGEELINVPDDTAVVRLPNCFESYGRSYRPRAKALHDALAAYNVDTLVHHQWLGLALPWDMLVAKSLGISCVMHVHGTFLSATAYELPELLQLPLSSSAADAVVCQSEADSQFWHQFVNNVYVKPNAIDKRFFSKAHPQRTGGTIAWSGRIDRDKNPLDAVYAMREILKSIPDAHLKMFGPWKDDVRAEMESMASSIGVNDRIEICGPRTHSELVEEYLSCDVFLHTSHLEGWCLALAEAKASGLPCVAYDLPYLDICTEGAGTLTTPVGYCEGLGQQVIRLMQDDALRERLSRNSLDWAHRVSSFDHASFWRGVFADLPASVSRVEKESPSPYRASKNNLLWKTWFWGIARKIEEKRAIDCIRKSHENEISRLTSDVASLNDKLISAQRELEITRHELDATQYELGRTKNSNSMKIGLALTAPLRKAKELARRLKG